MRPRATNDIDMILVVESMTAEFGQRFWDFIIAGEYSTRQRKRGDKEPAPELFRFINSKQGFPVQIELLSKLPDTLIVPTDFHLTPVPLGEELSSLSAILMDEVFYDHTIKNSIVEDGIRIASPLSLMCLKIKAFLNLTEDKLTNSSIHNTDIRKHRDDVFKLLAMRIDPLTPVELPASIVNDIKLFISIIEKSLPNQSLRDSLKRTDNDIRDYLEIMQTVFLPFNHEGK
jgi:hypothetical protein